MELYIERLSRIYRCDKKFTPETSDEKSPTKDPGRRQMSNWT